jgi:hypothetical protein
MTRRTLLACCCALALAAPLAAQAQKPKPADSLSGTWNGELVVDGRDPVSVTMKLTFDGKGGVTGSFTGLPSPGEVKAGTFDDKKGSLKLDLGKTGEAPTLLVLEGTIAKGVATGRVSGEHTGTFKLTRKQ